MNAFRLPIISSLLTVSLGLALLAWIGTSVPRSCQAAAPASSLLSQGKVKLAQGKYEEAIGLLEQAVKADPCSCQGNLCLGQAYTKLKSYGKACSHLRAALKLGKGGPDSIKANDCLLSLPESFVAPRTGAETVFVTRSMGLFFRDRGLAVGEGAKPTVIEFYASWCRPCQLLETAIGKAKSQYGEKVNFVSINVDDPNNAQMVDQYGVSPIPTVVFLNPEGEVVNYSIGYAGDEAVTRNIEKVLAKGT